MGRRSGGLIQRPAAGGGGTTTLNPSDKAAAITLSNGNLTASNTTFVRNNIRAIASHSTGKYYYEVTFTATNQGLDAIGIGNSTEVLTGSDVGSSANSVGWVFQNGVVNINTASIGTANGDNSQGTVGACAVDLTGQLIWFRFSVPGVTTTNWNASGSANPATGTGGFSIAGLAAGPYFPMLEFVQSTDVYTANFGATAYALAAPAGFGNW